MTDQPRVAKVLIALLCSMTGGAIVLLAIDGRPVPEGAFSLSSYSQLDSVSHALGSRQDLRDENWRSIDVHFSRTNGGDLDQVASLLGLTSAEDLNFHFMIGNGRNSKNGSIITTERWLKQRSSVPDSMWHGDPFTLRICVVGDSNLSRPTENQVRRTGTLVESLLRRFDISPENVRYPDGW